MVSARVPVDKRGSQQQETGVALEHISMSACDDEIKVLAVILF